MEIERKFLVPCLPEGYDAHPFHQIEQAYLCTEPVVRIRQEDDSFYLTYKGKGLLSREEYNLPLTREAYAHLLPKADGVVLTKLDGDTRGGAAISIRSVVSKPLKFISSGEKMDALQVFHPERMADRILGMGDVVSLVERAQEQFDEEEARRLKKKLVKNQFNFNDFIGQIQQIKKMGNLKDLAGMLPGVGKMLKNVDIPDDVFKQTEAIVSSMTPAEREHPEIINARRRERIAKGSGTTMADVNRLMKQFEDTRKMMKAVAGGNMKMPNMPGRRR